jgi:hypothetical protein
VQPRPVAPPIESPRRPAPVVVEQRPPTVAPSGRLELHPSYEPTTTTMLRARKSMRNFVIIIVVGAIVAIAVGVTVGYLIVGDEPPSKAPTKAAPKTP